jgi:hypothetical protein
MCWLQPGRGAGEEISNRRLFIPDVDTRDAYHWSLSDMWVGGQKPRQKASWRRKRCPSPRHWLKKNTFVHTYSPVHPLQLSSYATNNVFTVPRTVNFLIISEHSLRCKRESTILLYSKEKVTFTLTYQWLSVGTKTFFLTVRSKEVDPRFRPAEIRLFTYILFFEVL